MQPQISREVPFKNWTTEDFSHPFNGHSYKFEAGATYSVPADIALHFAKHLANRECHRLGLDSLPEQKVKEFTDNCFPAGSIDKAVSSGFQKIEIKDGKAEEVKAPATENKTDKDVQNETSENDEEDTADEKNNAGAPKFKRDPSKAKDKDFKKSK